MYKVFLDHQWKEFWRGRNKAGSIVANILFGFIILYLLVVAFAAGFFLKELIADIFPKENAIRIFNGFILYYFMGDFLIRIQFQELPTLSIVPYLHLNFGKNKIVNFLNIRSLFSAFNILPLFIFLPFCFTELLKTYGANVSIMYAITIFSLSLFNNFLALYVKRKSISNISYLFAGISVIAALGLLDHFKIISVSEGSNSVFTFITKYSFTGFLFTVAAVLIFIINNNYLRSNLYVEEIRKMEKKRGAADYPFLNRFGKAGELAALELKLIIRNRRPRAMILAGTIFIFYGIIIFQPDRIANDNFTAPIFFAILMTGIFIIYYGQLMFGSQSAHFDGILTNKISIRNFIKAKLLLFTLSSTLLTLICFFYGFISWKLILLLFAAYMYNIGFVSVLILFFATFKYKKIEISQRARFNYQGASVTDFLIVIPLLLIPFLLFWSFNHFHKPMTGLIVIALFGFITLLLRNFWIALLTKQFAKQRYKIAEGFRE